MGLEVARHELKAATPFIYGGRRWTSVVSWLEAPPDDLAQSPSEVDTVVAARYSQHVELFADLVGATDRDLTEVAASATVGSDEVLARLHQLRDVAVARLDGLRSAADVEAAASRPDVTARSAAARHPFLGDDTLAVLCDDPAPAVRAIAVRRVHPQQAGRRSDDPDRFVRRSLAERDDLDPDVLDVLGGDADLGVRHLVAKNPACPCETLQRLALDPSDLVRTRATRSLHRRAQDGGLDGDRGNRWLDPYRWVFSLQFFPFDADGLVFRLDPNVFGEYPYEVLLEELPVLDPLFTRVERALEGVPSVPDDVPRPLHDLVGELIDDMAVELRRLAGWRFTASMRR